MSTSAILLVDGMSVLKSTAGQAAHLSRGFTYSFLLQLTSVIKKLSPSAVIVCWEGGLGGRDRIYSEYKGERTGSSDKLKEQREELQKLLTLLGVEQVMCPGYEADDVIASLANTLPSDIVIYSNDKDFLQLVSDRIRVYQKPRIRGHKQRELIGPQNFEAMTGYRDSRRWAMGQCLLGDGVDGVPKVPFMTPVKVHAFLHNMEQSDAVRDRVAEALDSPEYARNSKLMDLRGVRHLDQPLKITYGKLSADEAYHYLQELGFGSIVAKFTEWFQTYEGVGHSDVSN